MYVEEATSSPIKTNKLENQQKFEIDKQKYSDEILYKKFRKKEKHSSRMTQSAYSVSSSSSDDKDYAPVFMNSFTGVLPDIRSPDSIKYDIEEKERMLEKMLDLDKVEIPDITKLDKITRVIEKNMKKIEISDSDEDIIEEAKTDKIICDTSSNNDIINHDKSSTNQENTSVSKLNSQKIQEGKSVKEDFFLVPCKYAQIFIKLLLKGGIGYTAEVINCL